MDEELLHYGVKRRSGRYPWGSGKDHQRSRDILSQVDELRAKGLSDVEVAKALGMNTSKLRSEITWANKIRREAEIETAQAMRERGATPKEIAERLGISERSVHNRLSAKDQVNLKQLDNVVEQLKNSIDEHGVIDIGVGVERQMGISRSKLKAAVSKLEEEGYNTHDIYSKRLQDPSNSLTVHVISKKDNIADIQEIIKEKGFVQTPTSYTEDGGLTFKKLKDPKSVDWDRVDIVYGDKGGTDKDGVIELRRGVKDLDLGDSHYAQVRIKVGKDHYLKGMAVYADDLPDGVDIRFNTNKPSDTPKQKVLKELKPNKDNPFGATINRQNGALNIVNEEGDWNKWSATLSSQFLSKQPLPLIKERLSATHKKALADLDEIMSLTNPVVKKHLLEEYADTALAKTRHLKVLGLPRTKGHVILPVPSLKDNEVYAPNYKDGERVVLLRYPHGGTFELPELTVNNKSAKARKMIGKDSIDAIGIHPSVAAKLSGADFDGDTVYVIPNNNRKVKTSKSLKGLKNFDPNIYAIGDRDIPVIKPRTKQIEMGKVSNLITDMTIKGANESELARAVRHSMVVIDSEKHKLDYRQSAIDNGIDALKRKYQTHTSKLDGKKHTSASTIISKSKQLTPDKKGYLMDSLDDANLISSGSPVEKLYAGYINQMKGISAKAKQAARNITPVKRNPQAAKKYAPEVQSLDTKLNRALANAPRERQAQLLAKNYYHKNKTQDMTPDQKKKLKTQAIATARAKTGANKKLVDITDKEWEAIQAGAISNNKLEQILKNADAERVKQLATPKSKKTMSPAKLARAKAMLGKDYTYAEVAEALGISVSTLRDQMKGD